MSFEDPHNALNRRGTDPIIEVLGHDMKRLREDMAEMKGAFVKMIEALNKLVIVEERQTVLSAANERAFTEIAKLQKRQDEDADRHAGRIELAINNVSRSIERVHTRLDEHGKELQNDIDGLNERLGVVEASMPETNRLKEWAFEAIKWAAVFGLTAWIARGGL